MRARIELGQLIKARSTCENALFTFIASRFSDEVKETKRCSRVSTWRRDIRKGLATLNEVLDHSGADVLPYRVASLYQWRARTNAALHNYRDAYNDLAEYMRRYVATNDSDRTKQAVALRARFETDREIERNALLKRELDCRTSNLSARRSSCAGTRSPPYPRSLVIALLIYFLVTNLRYRQQLVRLASQDGLTGLPNRRRTAELATDALAAATETEKPLTVAIIDMDHFKFINDRCGHATGDYVLREFARLGRESIRAGRRARPLGR